MNKIHASLLFIIIYITIGLEVFSILHAFDKWNDFSSDPKKDSKIVYKITLAIFSVSIFIIFTSYASRKLLEYHH